MSATVLVLTDFSPAADKALIYADALAAHLGTALVLLHVQRTSPLDPEALTGALSPLSEGEIAAALAQRRAGLRASATTEVAADRVPEAARAAVKRHQPALLVLGKSAAPGASPEVVAKTTALELLGSIGCPLLLVPESAAAAVLPRHITIAADNQPFALAPAATPATDLLAQLAAEFTVLHVAEPEDNDDTSAARQQVLASGLLPAGAALSQQGVRHLSIADGIEQGAHDCGADLLVLPARPHSWLGELFHHSVAARLVLRTTLPVLLVPVAG